MDCCNQVFFTAISSPDRQLPAASSRHASVPLLLGDDTPHATCGIGHVARKARDEMHVHVAYRLSGSATHVDPHVVALGRKLRIQSPLHIEQHRVHRHALREAEFEVVGDVTPGYYQRMPAAHRILVAYRQDEIVRGDDSIFRYVTEGAGHRSRSIHRMHRAINM